MAKDRVSILLIVALSAAFIAVWMMVCGLSFAIVRGSMHLLLGPCGILLGVLVRHDGDKRQDRLITAFEALSFFGTISLLGAVACYPAAAMSHGWADLWLARADQVFGLDWLTYHRWVQSSPILRVVLKAGYSSIFITPSLVIAALALSGRADRAYRFMLVYALALAIAIVCFIALPAAGADAFYLGLHSPGLPEGAVRQIKMIQAMQSGGLHVVSSDALIGPISFPSFHMASAVLFIWAAWPIATLRWPVVIVNLVMIAATPIYGGHYFVDLMGGLALAIFCISILRIRDRPLSGWRSGTLNVRLWWKTDINSRSWRAWLRRRKLRLDNWRASAQAFSDASKQ